MLKTSGLLASPAVSTDPGDWFSVLGAAAVSERISFITIRVSFAEDAQILLIPARPKVLLTDLFAKPKGHGLGSDGFVGSLMTLVINIAVCLRLLISDLNGVTSMRFEFLRQKLLSLSHLHYLGSKKLSMKLDVAGESCVA